MRSASGGFVGVTFGAIVLACASVHAQNEGAPARSFSAPHGVAVAGTRSYFGLNLGRAYTDSRCAATLLYCDRHDRSAQVFAGRMFDGNWGAEVGYYDSGRVLRGPMDGRSQAMSLSLVGRAQVLPSLDVYGKVGGTYSRPDTSVMGNASANGPEAGFGLSWGGGISYDLGPRLSASLEWGTYDLRLGSGLVRTGTLGLQYRY